MALVVKSTLFLQGTGVKIQAPMSGGSQLP